MERHETSSKFATMTIFLGLSVVVVLGHGCKQAIEPSPFFDGLSLTYIEIFEKSAKPEDRLWTREIRYEFHQVQEGAFKVTQAIQTKRGPAFKIDIPSPEVGQNLTIDSQGVVLRGGDGMNFMNGYPSYLWLNPKYRRKGKQVILFARMVRDQLSWEGWQVWAVVFGDTNYDNLYYDIKTGFLVGHEAGLGKLKMLLKETNLEGLKVSESNNLAEQTKNH